MKRRSKLLWLLCLGLAGCQSQPSPEVHASPSGASSVSSCSTPRSCEQLGIRYITGDGVRADGVRAARYLEQACRGGRASACNTAAFIYANAEEGAPQDYTKALEYWSRACRLGDASGCSNYQLAQDKLRALRSGAYR